MKQSGKGPKGSGSSSKQEVKRDRKSGTAFDGSPKKGGHGGKFTWSGDGYSEAELSTLGKEPIHYAIPKTHLNNNNNNA